MTDETPTLAPDDPVKYVEEYESMAGMIETCSALIESSYSLYNHLKSLKDRGMLPQFAQDQLVSIDTWIINYNILQAQFQKFMTKSTLH